MFSCSLPHEATDVKTDRRFVPLLSSAGEVPASVDYGCQVCDGSPIELPITGRSAEHGR
jgi:hypothetical protein